MEDIIIDAGCANSWNSRQFAAMRGIQEQISSCSDCQRKTESVGRCLTKYTISGGGMKLIWTEDSSD